MKTVDFRLYSDDCILYTVYSEVYKAPHVPSFPHCRALQGFPNQGDIRYERVQCTANNCCVVSVAKFSAVQTIVVCFIVMLCSCVQLKESYLLLHIALCHNGLYLSTMSLSDIVVHPAL